MIQNNYFSGNTELTLFFEKIIDWPATINAREQNFHDAHEYKKNPENEDLSYAPSNEEEALQNYQAVLDSIGEIAGKDIASTAAIMDKEGLKYANGKVTFPAVMVSNIKKIISAGLLPYGIGRKHGGLNIPITLQSMYLEILSRSDSSIGLCVGSPNICEIIERFASQEQVQKWLPKIVNGEYWCAMSLTEPNYGSDLPNIQTKALKDSNGNWHITGTKRFITHGCGFDDKPAVIITLARTGASGSGARGLSLFIVDGKDIEVAGVEKKLGIHCSPTCEIVYDNVPATLIGNENLGLIKYGMSMMNVARLAIAAQGVGVSEAAASEAKKYASEREQFGQIIEEIPAVSKILNRMDRELFAMRCLLYEAARTVDLYSWDKYSAMNKDKKETAEQTITLRKWEKLANLFTPLTKYYTSEMCNTLAYDAVQVHGGAGYTEEYDVARIFRDARITNIYEGTTQLQIVGVIGLVTSGMSEKGILREYIDNQLSKYLKNPELAKQYNTFDTKINASYRQIKNSALRNEFAYEVVESVTRILCGLLMEQAIERLKGGGTEKHHRQLADAYHIDSNAILQSNLIKLQHALNRSSNGKLPS